METLSAEIVRGLLESSADSEIQHSAGHTPLETVMAVAPFDSLILQILQNAKSCITKAENEFEPAEGSNELQDTEQSGPIPSTSLNATPWERCFGADMLSSAGIQVDDPCEKVVPAMLRRYDIDGDWREYALHMIHDGEEECLSPWDKPLFLFEELEKKIGSPMLMLRRHGPAARSLDPASLVSSSQDERPFKCAHCPQSFRRVHDLRRHTRIHLVEKRFRCEYCERSFARENALKVSSVQCIAQSQFVQSEYRTTCLERVGGIPHSLVLTRMSRTITKLAATRFQLIV